MLYRILLLPDDGQIGPETCRSRCFFYYFNSDILYLLAWIAITFISYWSVFNKRMFRECMLELMQFLQVQCTKTSFHRPISSTGTGRPEVPSHGGSCQPKPHYRGMAEHHGSTKTTPATVSRFQEGHEATARWCLSSNHVFVGKRCILQAYVGTTVSPSS